MATYRPALDTHAPEMLVRDAAAQLPMWLSPLRRLSLHFASISDDDIWVATAKPKPRNPHETGDK